MTRAAALASPVIWFANHSVQFALAPLACRWQSNVILWIVAAAALLLDVGCGAVAWHAWQRAEESAVSIMPPWLALSGVVLSASFFIVIVAQMIPTFILGWCA